MFVQINGEGGCRSLANVSWRMDCKNGSKGYQIRLFIIVIVNDQWESSVSDCWTNECQNLHETLRMIKFSVGVDDLGLGLEPVVAPGTAHTIHVHDAENNTNFIFYVAKHDSR